MASSVALSNLSNQEFDRNILHVKEEIHGLVSTGFVGFAEPAELSDGGDRLRRPSSSSSVSVAGNNDPSLDLVAIDACIGRVNAVLEENERRLASGPDGQQYVQTRDEEIEFALDAICVLLVKVKAERAARSLRSKRSARKKEGGTPGPVLSGRRKEEEMSREMRALQQDGIRWQDDYLSSNLRNRSKRSAKKEEGGTPVPALSGRRKEKEMSREMQALQQDGIRWQDEYLSSNLRKRRRATGGGDKRKGHRRAQTASGNRNSNGRKRRMQPPNWLDVNR